MIESWLEFFEMIYRKRGNLHLIFYKVHYKIPKPKKLFDLTSCSMVLKNLVSTNE